MGRLRPRKKGRRTMTKGLHVTSEIGTLKKVCLHRPGDELLNLPPDELERLLFDDVPFLEVAQQEHDTFAQILRDQGVEVLYLEQLVAEAFDAVPEARAEFLDQWLAEAGMKGRIAPAAVRELLEAIPDNLEFVKKTMAGVTKAEVELPLTSSVTLDSLVNTESESDLLVDPMPNLYFTRDPFAVVGNGVNLNRMYSVTRNRETIYGKYIFKYHPDYKDTSLYFRRDSSLPHRGRRRAQHQRAHHRCGHLSAHPGCRYRRHGPEHVLELRLADRHHPGVRHPGLPCLHAPGYGLHPDRP